MSPHGRPQADSAGARGESPVSKRAYARIIGTGSALPGQAVSNEELARDLATRGVETSDAWIIARTGIRQRYIAERGTTTAELGADSLCRSR